MCLSDSTKFIKLIKDTEESNHINLLKSININDDNEGYTWYSTNFNKFFPEKIELIIDTMIVDTVIDDTLVPEKNIENINVNLQKNIFDDSLKMNININKDFKMPIIGEFPYIKSEAGDTTINSNEAAE